MATSRGGVLRDGTGKEAGEVGYLAELDHIMHVLCKSNRPNTP